MKQLIDLPHVLDVETEFGYCSDALRADVVTICQNGIAWISHFEDTVWWTSTFSREVVVVDERTVELAPRDPGNSLGAATLEWDSDADLLTWSERRGDPWCSDVGSRGLDHSLLLDSRNPPEHPCD